MTAFVDASASYRYVDEIGIGFVIVDGNRKFRGAVTVPIEQGNCIEATAVDYVRRMFGPDVIFNDLAKGEDVQWCVDSLHPTYKEAHLLARMVNPYRPKNIRVFGKFRNAREGYVVNEKFRNRE